MIFFSILALIFVARSSASSFAKATAKCRCFAGDDCWPLLETWSHLNHTVGGRLIATVPLAAACHDPKYDDEACKALRKQWLYSGVHMRSSSSIMAPLFANQSCDPFTPKETPCTLGNYVAYAVNASSSDHVIKAVNFAQKHNIRFVVRNTGHDYLGRSTGASALAVWTHHLKSTEILDWKDDYEGKALKLGAGIQGFEALAAAKEAGLVLVTGECPTVGVAGGYLQGGGHSGLSTAFGLAADNALAFEVVTPTGQLLAASRSEHTDLYWALSGGGGGTYGIVTSVTVKAHPDNIVGGATFAVTVSNDEPGKMFDIIDAWHTILPRLVDSGVMVIYFFGASFLQVPALTAYGKTAEEVREMLRPFIDSVAGLNATFEPTISEFSSYHDHYERYWGPLPEGNIQVGTMLFGGRLIPRNVIATSAFSSAAKQIAQMGVTFIGVGTNVSRFGQDSVNSVLPQWRSSIVQASLILPWSFEAPWEEMLEAQRKITDDVQPVIEAVTPSAGAYMNEADFQQSDWKETFFGKNYARLREIKKRYDPQDLLYGVASVGSEDWNVGTDGRMCRTVLDHNEDTKHIEL